MDYFYEQGLSPENESFSLSGREHAHILKVLRYKAGDSLKFIDGRGGRYDAIINSVSSQEILFGIRNYEFIEPDPCKLHIAIGLIKKAERLEWFVEKAVELGVSAISFFSSSHSEKKNLNIERINKIIISAMKQSGNPWLPVLNTVKSFDNFLLENPDGQKFIGYCENEDEPHLAKVYLKGKDATVLIGPEGDFTEDEVTLAEKAGYKRVSLGKNRLRTETAALYSLMIMQAINNR